MMANCGRLQAASPFLIRWLPSRVLYTDLQQQLGEPILPSIYRMRTRLSIRLQKYGTLPSFKVEIQSVGEPIVRLSTPVVFSFLDNLRLKDLFILLKSHSVVLLEICHCYFQTMTAITLMHDGPEVGT